MRTIQLAIAGKLYRITALDPEGSAFLADLIESGRHTNATALAAARRRLDICEIETF